MIKLIIFDFDGPILDSFKEGSDAVNRAIEQLTNDKLVSVEKLPRPDESAVILNWGYPGNVIIKKFFPSLEEKEIFLFEKTWMKVRKDKDISLVDRATEVLRELKKSNFFLVLLTSRVDNLKYHLEENGLIDAFDLIQSWEHPKVKEKERVYKNHIYHPAFKPNPEVFDEILKWAAKRGVKKEEMILIDDTLVGLEAARAAGIAFLGVCTGPLDSKEKWQKYGRIDKKQILKSIAELPRWLKKHR